MDYALEIKGLEKCYSKGNKVLKGIDIKIEEGIVAGFIGMNGAGKTTTIKSILGLVVPNAGEIKIFGKSFKENEKEIKNRIGIVFDNGYLYEDLKLSEMKQIFAAAYTKWDEDNYKKYIKNFNLNEKQKVKELSKGMKMKFSLALALSHHADLLIMDEPTSGLDPKIRKEFLDIIREFIIDVGKTVFFSTHITTDLDKIADQIIMLNAGEVIFNKDKDILIDEHALVKGDKTILTNDNRKWFVALEERGFSFEGLTNQRERVRQEMKQALCERPTIEDIMVAYMGR
ncbi:ABC-2 type transport system ATP-binding protein [Lachnotalea glycerini]|uniref:ABC-2 type transport system ATP-binding protein n=1 Tax=Lachnotalea glycerini TaxID=1763509 RepID=A0A318EVI2_9FIRM|nr:ABC transporter ATP-binding protein [Lachnotalea glycerini]PXV96242.1 ABC-2 type transport system ATP-binding protein [Lachnotalea glycerini]